MILELGDGREVKLPDEMNDESARLLKRLILGAEERARVAEGEVRLLRDEMTALRAHVASVAGAQQDHRAIVMAIGQMHSGLAEGLGRVTAAARADRMMVRDEMGEMTRSRAV